eukprot:1063814-Pyramimonas_sp.AAC.1
MDVQQRVAAARMATMDPEQPSPGPFSWRAAARAEMFRMSGASLGHVLSGRLLRPCKSHSTGPVVQLQAESKKGSARRDRDGEKDASPRVSYWKPR